jgi:hypothetical protein
MIGQTEVGLLSGKGPLIATFCYEKSDTRLYHFCRSNMSQYLAKYRMFEKPMSHTYRILKSQCHTRIAYF